MKYRSVWISDVHLGTNACKTDLLRSFLKQLDTEKLYLVGDIVDGWALKSKWFWPPEHNEIVRLLLKMSKTTQVIYVAGNHDETLRQFCPLQLGNVDVRTYTVHETLKGKRMVVLHGDIFDSFVTNLKHVAVLGSVAYDALIAANNATHWFAKKFGLPYWSLAEWLKTHAREAMKAIGRFEAAAAGYAKNKGFDGVIAGHLHHATIREIGGTTYVNCGDWVSSCTAIVEDEAGELKLIRWAEEVKRLPIELEESV